MSTSRGWAALAALLLVGLSLWVMGRPNVYTTRAAVFGTLADITADATAQPAVDAVFAHWQQRERDWHAWQTSALTAFNSELQRDSRAGVPDSLKPLFNAATPARAASGGWFDPGIGELVAAWGFHTSDYPVSTPAPTSDWQAAWREHPPCWQLQGDRVTTCGRVAQFDFNAIAEGVALDEARALLQEQGVHDALLSLGGDVLALGSKAGQPWRVGLLDGEGGVLGGVELHNGEAFLSSGSYVKYRPPPDGQRWPHVLDPFRGEPAHGARLSAVLHRDPAWADAAATALLAAGPGHFEALTGDLRLGCALLVDAEGRVWITWAMAERFEWREMLPEAARVNRGADCAAR